MNLSTVKYFAGFLRKYTWQECFLVLLMFLASIGTLVSPYVLKLIIDDVFPSRDFGLLIEILAIYLAISVVRLIISYASDYMFEYVSNHIMKDIRVSLFSHLIRLPLSFFDNSKTGDIIHRVNSEVNSIQSILTGSIVRIINSLCTIIGLVVMLCVLNYKLFLISLCVFPIIYVNTRYFQPRIQDTVKQSRTKDSDILSYLMERFSNIKLLKSYMHYGWEESRLSIYIDEQIGINMRNVKLTSLASNVSMFLTALVPILLLFFGGKNVMAGIMTVGSLVAFIQYTNRLFAPMRDLMGLYFDVIRASVSMERIAEVISLQQERTGGSGSIGAQSEQAAIEFRNVCFQYDSSPVLTNINLKINPNTKYALVGTSGCGKSTLINLLCRFYEPQQGGIYFRDTNIRDIDMTSWRNRIVLVNQDNHLFHGTILENIRYGMESASFNQIEEATRQSVIKDHIESMPGRFDSVIGDHGVTLSGGQKQRIAIARSILKQAQIVLLDETTSAIDSETEKIILHNLFRIHRDRTILIVSHRLSAIKNVDQIICMDKGMIVEVGTHEELIGRKGYYWKLYKEQV